MSVIQKGYTIFADDIYFEFMGDYIAVRGIANEDRIPTIDDGMRSVNSEIDMEKVVAWYLYEHNYL